MHDAIRSAAMMPLGWLRQRRHLIRFDWRGEGAVVATTFGLGAVMRLGSSLVLTRLLYPEVYGIVAMLASVLFVVEMLSDVGVVGLVIRHERGAEAAFVDTLWTVRLMRGLRNFAIVFAGAPWIAAALGEATLADPLRVVSLMFLFKGMEAMTFALALRERRSRWVSWITFGCSAATTLLVIAWSWFSRDHWGMVAGMVFGQALTTLLSHLLSPRARPRWTLERPALRELFGFAKYVMPSSLLTMLLAQFDKLVFLRLFDLRTMGVYGVAGSLAGPTESLAVQVGDAVLYPRCAQAHRDDPSRLRECFYRDNAKLLVFLAAVPALIGGAGQFIVDLLFDPRYREAGFVVQWLMLRGVLLAVLRPSEALQTAAGHPSVQLLSNSLRLAWLVPISLLGYWSFGFAGFVAGAALEPCAATAVVLWKQARRGLLEPRHEVLRVVGIALVWALSWSASGALASLLGDI